MNTISTPTIEAIISRNEIIELIDANHDMSDLVLISISEPVLEGYHDEALTDSQVANFKDSIRVKFWDITDPIGHYDVISDETALLLQQFILSHISDRFIIHCRAGQSRSAGVGKAIECIKYFGIGETAKRKYQTAFLSEIDIHSRYFPNLTVFNKLVKDYYMNISDYYDGADKLTADHGSSSYFKISPSQAASFFTNTTMWYREALLGEKQIIENQDSLTLGTIVHYFAEQASLKIRPTDPDKLVSDYLDSQTVTDRSEILSLWRDMSNTLIQGCIHGRRPPIATELFMFHKLLPGIYVAGTTDAIINLGNGSVSIRDYKTASTKPSGIPYNYRLQAHIYAFLATKAGYTVSQIELQYVIRPTKTLPCRHFEFTEPFTSDDLDKITNQLQLIAESVHFWNTHPQYRYLLAQDYRLKPPSKPTLLL